MRKRTFLKTSTTLAAGSLLAPLASCIPNEEPTTPPMTRTNWAGNYTYQAKNFHQPNTVEEVQAAIKQCDKVRLLGTKHCFNAIADSPYNQLSVRALNKVVGIDKEKQTVRIEAGMSYGQLCPWLDQQGYAIHNLASLPHISVAGACATATHGSGMQNGNLATPVVAIEFVDAAGKLHQLSREKDGEKFSAVLVHLGGLGAITSLDLKIEPSYQAVQHVYQDVPVAELKRHFEDIMSSGYSVSLFTDWQTDRVNQVWIKSKADAVQEHVGGEAFYGGRLFDRKVHPILDLSAEACTEQLGQAGPWYDRLPHFKMEFTPSSGEELQSEFFVPLGNAMAAFEAIQNLKDLVGPLLMISEVRAIAADDFWMSPCFEKDSIAFHFTWKQDWDHLQRILPSIESALEPFEARPHWGKNFTISRTRLRELYPRWGAYRDALRAYDPDGKFVNPYLEKHLFG